MSQHAELGLPIQPAMPPPTWARKLSGLYAIVVINVGVAILVDSGLIIWAARSCRGEMIRLFPFLGYRRYPGGYSEEMLATCLLIPNLFAQAVCVRAVIRFFAPEFVGSTSFRRTVWRRALLWGVPLILAVFVFDLVTSAVGTSEFASMYFLVAWMLIFGLSAMLCIFAKGSAGARRGVDAGILR